MTADPISFDAPRIFQYWLRTVEACMATLNEIRLQRAPKVNSTRIILGFLSPEIYLHVEKAVDCDAIVGLLHQIYIKCEKNVCAHQAWKNYNCN